MSHKLQRLHDLVRMLNLLPYFKAHPGRSMLEAAADLGTTPEQIRDDLNRLFCCGPGSLPDELVDLDPNLKAVHVIDAQGMDTALRLTRTEAGALLLALESLEQVPGLVSTAAVESAAAKIRGIMAQEAAAVVDSTAVALAPAEVLETIRQAMAQRQQLRFSYLGQGEQEPSTRTVSAARLFTAQGHSYLTAWEEAKGDHRTFRLDRMSAVELHNQDSRPHLHRLTQDPEDPFGFAHVTAKAHFLIRQDALWLAEGTAIEVLGASDQHGWVECSAPLVAQAWLVEFALRNADRVRVIAPAEAAEEVRERAQRAAQAYGTPAQV
ncbi:WYL domain-containing protein [Corynebacterium sp. 153RC1]|uniref:helix-turn-helix transcriptional regulator n=1 Tax=unclassified Corynebacterium TaxID=2624378 RepID=UPI00211BD72D|nr:MULTISPECIES: WYL domain-containing protein [unclassified Corynebacterium]MCQ9352445.1 WYL domain-containing protein [Corynebacterium sp. 209RC1]MCQ9354383.1 WYL domain-containing protein [Corynebacterium sp. 1222RC1]MCQ9356728.1 WYL domain-containing protein [Corynebacterium sp. 122RC1]MCQ9358778.1 WYL domain-containing protein [Corynebacterium sp. 142RC1]MCQ9361176.1 WYL domain-containing protein [Corynebacterium sp. 153RC1]